MRPKSQFLNQFSQKIYRAKNKYQLDSNWTRGSWLTRAEIQLRRAMKGASAVFRFHLKLKPSSIVLLLFTVLVYANTWYMIVHQLFCPVAMSSKYIHLASFVARRVSWAARLHLSWDNHYSLVTSTSKKAINWSPTLIPKTSEKALGRRRI